MGDSTGEEVLTLDRLAVDWPPVLNRAAAERLVVGIGRAPPGRDMRVDRSSER